ncbi:hypothetical protein CH63R_08393 [Colletotrichum higginsianum IMI 349063]|uniref:Uncharacterized protein n=1 Tax=Colletotrichum higginsianum (strain IMI 349063) TaxID=759273 RepID=A0A1B7YCR1_COLHI|nr:hypothetical protein CH63R_08393 [Colletotrichum higginsianum IMI 349063]OBR09628.1 hypothetical protein CH63R_08393 [Colletotrichum higginsianum IMI 349063]
MVCGLSRTHVQALRKTLTCYGLLGRVPFHNLFHFGHSTKCAQLQYLACRLDGLGSRQPYYPLLY